MSKLIRWETPFTEGAFPSIGLVVSLNDDAADLLKAVVAPFGIEKYPKYIVDFGEIVAFTCMEEAYAPKMDFASAEIEEDGLCAYKFLNSPWIESYKPWIPFFTGNKQDSFHHYLIFGGDNNIEVITSNEPKIKIVNEKIILKLEYEI